MPNDILRILYNAINDKIREQLEYSLSTPERTKERILPCREGTAGKDKNEERDRVVYTCI